MIHSVVSALLAFGLAGSILAAAAHLLPNFGGFWAFLRSAAAVTGTFTGILTLCYLFLNRMLSQIEADLIFSMMLE